ncbi:MAG: tetratricopeptide repeat protein [Caulobacteraceae bacterium]
MLPVFGLSLLFSIALCVHVVRTGQAMYWLMIILILQPLGGLVYLVAIVMPSLAGGPTARRLGQGVGAALDPTREYREAKAACQETPTVYNQMRLARAATALGHFDEAEQLYGHAAQGVHAEDPTLLMGRAVALIELGRFEEALALLDVLGQDAGKGRTPAAALALGRAYEGLGRLGEADTAYQWAAGRLPGLEGLGRYAAFLARAGRRDEAAQAVGEMDRRIAKANPQFRREGRAWRDLAARALAA